MRNQGGEKLGEEDPDHREDSRLSWLLLVVSIIFIFRILLILDDCARSKKNKNKNFDDKIPSSNVENASLVKNDAHRNNQNCEESF